ncbi:MAG: carboxypeptidase regulatory-like domain-containing protein [Chloroflexi bacterium]|nr:carboxypeptidase regulatory-like domain-containing protein [Chloroflexota bacterium]
MMELMNVFRRLLRWVRSVAALLILAAIVFLCAAEQNEIVFARHLLLYRLEMLWYRPASVAGSPGELVGAVFDEQGRSLAGATVVAAAADGRAFSTTSDGDGRYRLSLPPGAYVPMATRAGYADITLRFGPFRRSVMIAPGQIVSGDFALRPAPRVAATPGAPLRFGAAAISHVQQPHPSDVRRRPFTFEANGRTLGGSYVYEPLPAGRYPMVLILYPCWEYPCTTDFWDTLSATVAAQGLVVIAFAPQRALDLEGDMGDIQALLVHLRAGEASAQGDPARIALMAGSISSLHLWRTVELSPPGSVSAAVVLGGVSDIFLVRQRYDTGQMTLEPQFADALYYGLIGLGRPNLSPEFYVRYSAVYHLDALAGTALAIIHGGGDVTVPVEQAEHFDRRLTERGITHSLVLYPTAQHYLDLVNIGPDELDMLSKVTGFLRQTLGP